MMTYNLVEPDGVSSLLKVKGTARQNLNSTRMKAMFVVPTGQLTFRFHWARSRLRLKPGTH